MTFLEQEISKQMTKALELMEEEAKNNQVLNSCDINGELVSIWKNDG